MSRITQKGATAVVELFNTSADASLASLTGSKYSTSDGRDFVLVQNAGTALASGKLVQGPAIHANHQNMATSTAAIGATQVTVTLGNTAATANQYAGGYLIFNAGTGAGQTFKVASHPSASASATLVVTLEDKLSVASLSSDTKSCLSLPTYGSSNGTDFRTEGVIICPANNALTGPVIGVTIYPIAATSTTVLSYGLIQIKGVCAVLNDSTTAIGLDVMPGAVAGSVATFAVATSSRVGTASQAGVDTESRLITLQL